MVEITHKDTGNTIYRFDGTNLVGASLFHRNLSYANLEGQDLRKANLEEANLSEAILTNANLTQACLRGAKLRRAKLTGTVLEGTDLRDADLRAANLDNADMRGADLRGADIVRASLRDVSITGANFNGVKTRSAKIITFREAPDIPIARPQEMTTSICKECGRESLGRYFGFHYGVLTEYTEGRWGRGATGMMREISSKHRILGYREVFLCKRCIGKQWRRVIYLSPIVLLSWLALFLIVYVEPSLPTLIGLGLIFVLAMIGFVGLIFVVAVLFTAVNYYYSHNTTACEAHAASLVELQEKGKKDKIRILDSDFYCNLD